MQLALNMEPREEVVNEAKSIGVERSTKHLPDEDEVRLYKMKYASKSQSDLKEIITSQKYTAAAMEAARQLIAENKGNCNSE